MPKLYDLVATTGSYEKDGATKYINRNVGSVMEYEGKQYVLLDPSFNPAGCLRQRDGQVRVAMFEPKPRHEHQAQTQSHDDLSDSIPF